MDSSRQEFLLCRIPLEESLIHVHKVSTIFRIVYTVQPILCLLFNEVEESPFTTPLLFLCALTIVHQTLPPPGLAGVLIKEADIIRFYVRPMQLLD